MMIVGVLALLIGIVVVMGSLRIIRKRSRQSASRFHLPASKFTTLPEPDALGLTVPVKTENTPPPELNLQPESYLVLHVIAPREYPYNGYELLQTLLANGLRYGEKNIFHRHEAKTGRGKILFSLASVNKPGTFELTKMGNFTCPGLTLFMPITAAPDCELVFDTMLETARQLVEDLGGEIWDDQRIALTQATIAAYRSAISRVTETSATAFRA